MLIIYGIFAKKGCVVRLYVPPPPINNKVGRGLLGVDDVLNIEESITKYISESNETLLYGVKRGKIIIHGVKQSQSLQERGTIMKCIL